MDDQPILSCSILAARVDGHKIDTLEGLQEEAARAWSFYCGTKAEQCGTVITGMIMNAIALFREIPNPRKKSRSRNTLRTFADVLDEGQLRES